MKRHYTVTWDGRRRRMESEQAFFASPLGLLGQAYPAISWTRLSLFHGAEPEFESLTQIDRCEVQGCVEVLHFQSLVVFAAEQLVCLI